MKDKTEEKAPPSESTTLSIKNRNTLFSTESTSKPVIDDAMGAASSIDRLKDFDSKKQDEWLKYSNKIINELSELLPTFPQTKPNVREDIRCPEAVFKTQVGCAYAFLASKRRQVAKNLKHGPLRHQFGLFNKAGFASTDNFNLSQDIPTQKDKIYEHVSSLINQSSQHIEVDKQINEEKEGSYIYTIKIKLNPDEKNILHNKNMNSELPFIEDDVALTITLHDYGKDNDRTFIIIDHSPTPFAEDYRDKSSYFQIEFELIEPYFKACLNWNPSEDVKEFLMNAGKLAYSLARLQPVGRGNSAIAEWMVRSLAKTNNIKLGTFNHSEQIGWDFKAFLTPDIQDYAIWFAEKAFVSCAFKAISSAHSEGAIDSNKLKL